MSLSLVLVVSGLWYVTAIGLGTKIAMDVAMEMNEAWVL